MTLSPEQVAKFREIYKRQYNTEISDAEAHESGQNLVNFMKILIELDEKKEKKDKK